MSEIASVLLVNRAVVQDRGSVLLLKRAYDDPHNPGLWEFPGGKADAGEDIHEGLTREVHEETGLVIQPYSSIVHIESEVISAGKYQGKLYVALFHAARRLSGDLQLSNEHVAAGWVRPRHGIPANLTPESMGAIISLRRAGVI
ncbi:MAG TPA: NUDIX domain-containing protein [Candidatus Saccharibacteria bacterium]|nr:NUDIX domain-containing protein [Candidatus Saccharibacteria bacterium]